MFSKESSIFATSVPRVDWLKKNEEMSTSIWKQQWSTLLHKGDKEELKDYLTSFCFSVLDLNDKEQVFVVRIVFISIITDVLSRISKKHSLRPEMLNDAYGLIYEIETWENLSHYILNIPNFLDTIIDKLIFARPYHDHCPKLDQAIQLINEHIKDRKLTVKWLAGQLGISTTHLSNLFRLNVGMNASDYIAQRKIAEITYEIVHTSKSLAEIREAYGFQSHSHFIQFFKKHKGKTPLKYRQHVLNLTKTDE